MLSAPTQQSKLVDNKIKYLERKAMAIKQKREVGQMAIIPKTEAVNQTYNADMTRYETNLHN